jgi:hypothetical protein
VGFLSNPWPERVAAFLDWALYSEPNAETSGAILRGMTTPQPPDKPRFGQTYYSDADGLLAWDGTAWVLFEDMPEGPDDDPNWLIRGYPQ